MKYLELVEKYSKEKSITDQAIDNATILKSMQNAKISAADAEITRRKVKVNIAKKNVEIAIATLTDDSDIWNAAIDHAEENLAIATQDVIDVQDLLENYIKRAKLFVKK